MSTIESNHQSHTSIFESCANPTSQMMINYILQNYSYHIFHEKKDREPSYFAKTIDAAKAHAEYMMIFHNLSEDENYRIHIISTRKTVDADIRYLFQHRKKTTSIWNTCISIVRVHNVNTKIIKVDVPCHFYFEMSSNQLMRSESVGSQFQTIKNCLEKLFDFFGLVPQNFDMIEEKCSVRQSFILNNKDFVDSNIMYNEILFTFHDKIMR